MFDDCILYNHTSRGGAGWGPDSKFSPRGPEFVVTPLVTSNYRVYRGHDPLLLVFPISISLLIVHMFALWPFVFLVMLIMLIKICSMEML